MPLLHSNLNSRTDNVQVKVPGAHMKMILIIKSNLFFFGFSNQIFAEAEESSCSMGKQMFLNRNKSTNYGKFYLFIYMIRWIHHL